MSNVTNQQLKPKYTKLEQSRIGSCRVVVKKKIKPLTLQVYNFIKKQFLVLQVGLNWTKYVDPRSSPSNAFSTFLF